ncbi:MAG: tRNA (adenosine(37)-N6)-threonylcarbamoyltransferase complex dimerization subunit type 1 TsaB [Thermodesulfobacteria bacterium]|nr:tRNA (adenosine(37)-N6)-threonylcarbamoyltransferase complex dimerization subunit type 1 TsaB [Thermodesulfobacteriota bacterium]
MTKDEKLILALETASPCGGVALVGEEVYAEITLASKETYSRRLLQAVEYLFQQLGVGFDDLAAVAVSIGPGSFTGLRIGLATAKGLHFALGLPLIGVETLKALAMNVLPSPKLICPVLDARRKQVYTALYHRRGDELEEVIPPSVLSPEKLLTQIKEPALFLGDGLRTFGEFLKEGLGEKFEAAPPHLRHLRPANVGVLGRKRALEGKFDDPLRLLPLYLRPSEAELKRGLPA